MDNGKQLFDGALGEQRQQEKVCGKICFISNIIKKIGRNYHDFYIFVVDLLLLGKGLPEEFLEPHMILAFWPLKSICGLNSTLYVIDCIFEGTQNVYFLDIQAEKCNKHFFDDDLRPLPPMAGKKYAALITPIPGTKKLLVFSSVYQVFCFYPDLAAARGDDSLKEFSIKEGAVEDVDFEIYDLETKLWEKLPNLTIRADRRCPSKPLYFLHRSPLDESLIPFNIFARDEVDQRVHIARYTFINRDTVFLAQLSCGVKLTLDLNSPSKRWMLFNEEATFSPDRNLFVVEERWEQSWCACDIGGTGGDGRGGFGSVVSIPLSLFSKEDELKWHGAFSTRTLLEGEGENHMCIVQGGVSRKTKHGHVIMDVVDVKAKNQPKVVASGRFEVKNVAVKRFWPSRMFVYHPNGDNDDIYA